MQGRKPGLGRCRLAWLLVTVGLLLGAQHAAAAGSASVTIQGAPRWNPTYTWSLSLDATQPAPIPVGGSATISYRATPTATLASATVTFDAQASCTPDAGSTATATLVEVLVNGVAAAQATPSPPLTAGGPQVQTLTGVPGSIPDAAATTQLQVAARCTFDDGTQATSGSTPLTYVEQPGGRPTSTLTASTVLPSWSSYSQPPRLVTPPTVTVSSGRPEGLTVNSGQQVSWSIQLDKVLVCLTGAQAVTTASLTGAPPGSIPPNVVSLSTADSCQIPSATVASPTGDGRVVSTFTWTVDKSVTPDGAVTISRGQDVTLEYTLLVTKTPASFTATLTTLSVPVTNPATLSTSLDKCDLVYQGNVVATKTGQTIAAGASATLQFTNVALSSSSTGTTSTTGATAPASVDITARCYFDGNTATPVDATSTINLNADTTSSSGATAKIADTFTYPTWSSNLLSNLLPAPVPAISGNNPNGQVVSDTTTFIYTLRLPNVVLCVQGQTITNTATVTPVATGSGTSTGTSTDSTATTITVTDCNACPTINTNNLRTTTTITNTWAHSMAPIASSGATVPWGGGATIRMRSTLTRQVASFTSTLTAELAINNPTAGPIIINSITLQCQATGTIQLPCGSLTASNNNFGQLNTYSGSGALLVPAGQTTTCQFTNQPLAGSATTNFQQPCTISIITASGTTCNSGQFTLDLMSPTFKNDINNCVDYTVTCDSTGGSQYYSPAVFGGFTTQVVCPEGDGQLPRNVEYDVSVTGGFRGDGTLPGSCSTPAKVTCTGRGIGITTVGSGGSQQQIAEQRSELTFSPVDCPLPAPSPPPSTAPVNPPPTAPGGLGFSASRNPVVTVDVQETIIRGAFDWQAAIATDPATLDIPVGGDARETTYTVQLTRVPAANAAPPSYLLRGVVTVANPSDNTGPLQITRVTTVVGTTSQPLASCSTGGAQVALPFTLQVGAALTCPFFFTYDPTAPLSNSLFGRATIMTANGEVTPTNSDARADFSFAGSTSNTQEAQGACATVWMQFNTDHLGLTRTTGQSPPFVAAEAQQVCDSTTFTFGVLLAPQPSAPCGPTQVLSTALVDYNQGQAQQVRATNQLGVTISGACAAPAEAAAAAPAPAGGSTTTPGGDGTPVLTDLLALEIQGVSSRDVESVVWGLQMQPDKNEVEMGSSGADVKYNITWTKTTETVTEVSGSVVITNSGVLPALLEGVTVELVTTLRRGRTTIAQASAMCPFPDGTTAEISSSKVLPVAASVTCTFTVKAKSMMGASLLATAALADTGDAVSSPAYAISQFREASAAPGCARLLSGLAASVVVAGGRLAADPEGVVGPEVCEAGSKQVTFKVAVPPAETLCGDYQVTALASLVPATDTTRTPLFATSTAKVRLLSGCVIQVNDVSLSVSRLRGVKTRIMNWTISRSVQPELPAGSALQVPATENVTDVFQRSLVPGQFLQLTGSALVRTVTGGDTTPLQQTQVLALALCVSGAQCSAAVPAPKPTCNITGSSGVCPFRFDKLPAAGILLLPVLDAPVPGVTATFFSPNAATRRQVLGKCAKLSVAAPTVSPADQGVIVTVTNIANAPPEDAVCTTSWVTTRQFVLEAITGCPDVPYPVAGEARAVPTDAAAEAAVAQLAFEARCQPSQP